MKKNFILMLLLVILLAGYNVNAFEIVKDTYEDQGYISSAFLNPKRETDRTVRYTPWLINYALQTEEEARSVKGGEGFQQISDIAISPVDNNLMLMGTDTCGIWRSEDGGENWLSVNDGVNCWGVHDIIFHPTQKNIAYMIQGGANASVSTSQIQERGSLDGLYKSEDGGNSWKQILDVNIRASLGTNRLIAFDDNLNLYLLTAEGLLKSDDSGKSWSNLYRFYRVNEESVNYDLCISGNTIAFTNDTYGVFASEDAGQTWEIRNLNSDSLIPAYGLDIDPENSKHWLVCFGSPYYEVYESFDSGRNWSILPVTTNMSPDGRRYPWKIMFGRREPNGERNLYMLFGRNYTPLRVSSDDGKTWNVASYTTPWGEDYWPLYGNAISLEHNDPNTIFLGVGTVMKSNDGGQSFSVRNTAGYSGANIEEIKFSKSGKLYLSTTDHGYYKSTAEYKKGFYPTFQHTRDQDYGIVGDIGIDPIDENHIIYAESGYSLRESNDGGLTWTKIDGTKASYAPSVIEFHKEKDIIYSTYFTSRDRGYTWTPNDKNIHAVSDVDNDVVYSRSGKILYKSYDCGITFSELYTADWNITYILPDNTNSDIVYIGIQNGNIIKIENGQATVMNEINGLSNVSPRAIAQNPSNPQHIVMGGQCVDYSEKNKAYYDNYCKTPGLYETFDGGVSWHIVKGMPSMRVVYSLAFSPNTHEVFVGGFTGGLLIYNYEAYNKYLSGNINNHLTVVYNGNSRMVTVSGTMEKVSNGKNFSTLLVIPADIVPENATALELIYLAQVETDEYGDFDYSFEMPSGCDYGTYNVYIGGSGITLPSMKSFDNGEFEVISFEFENSQGITATASFLNTTIRTENIVLHLAQYETDDANRNRLIDIKSEHHEIPSGGSIVTKKITSSLDERTDVYRAFLWSDDGALKPLTGCIENKVNGE